VPTIDTTPDFPQQPDQWVEKAAADLPSILQEMPNESGYGATEPGRGHRIVLAQHLVEEVAGKRGHPRAAVGWAIHHLVQRGLLLAEIGVKVEMPIVGHRPDENSIVVKARRLFGSHADSLRYQVPVYGDPVRKPLAPTDRPVPYDCLLVRSTPALWEWWQKTVVPTGTGPEFTESDFERALAALDLCLQDYVWQPGDNKLTVETLLGALKAKEITLALAMALLRRLIDQQVFKPWSQTIPAGYSYEQGCPFPIHRLEPETTHCLVTTRERWYGYLADHKRRRGAEMKKDEQPAAPRPTQIDTRPDSPIPPEPMIEAAMRDIPGTMADMKIATQYGAPAPPAGQRIVLLSQLVRELGKKRQHGKAASEWAVHRLVQQGALSVRYGRSTAPGVISPDGGWAVKPVEHEVKDLSCSLIQSTPSLWDLWENAEKACSGDPNMGIQKTPPSASDLASSCMDLGIIVPLDEEFRELFEEIKGRCQVISDPGTGRSFYLFAHPGRDPRTSYRCVATFAGEMGHPKTALVTDNLLSRWNPGTVVLLGIAGGISKDVSAGDVVVATTVDSYSERGKATPRGEKGFHLEYGGEVYRCSSELSARVQHFEFSESQAHQRWLQCCSTQRNSLISEEQQEQLIKATLLRTSAALKLGHIASGPTVGATKPFIERLKQRDRNYLALEMEAGGLMAAVSEKANVKRTLILRGISDYADERKEDLDMFGGGAIRRYAMRNVISLLWALLETDTLPRQTGDGRQGGERIANPLTSPAHPGDENDFARLTEQARTRRLRQERQARVRQADQERIDGCRRAWDALSDYIGEMARQWYWSGQLARPEPDPSRMLPDLLGHFLNAIQALRDAGLSHRVEELRSDDLLNRFGATNYDAVSLDYTLKLLGRALRDADPEALRPLLEQAIREPALRGLWNWLRVLPQDILKSPQPGPPHHPDPGGTSGANSGTVTDP
jgi:nucleoside phosphorylase